MRSSLSREQRNLIMYSLYTTAQEQNEAKGRVRFSKSEITALLEQIRLATGDPKLTWDKVQRRVNRLEDKTAFTRVSGSGRKTTFTPEFEDAAKTVARRFSGDISKTFMYHQVKAAVGSPNMCGKSTFIRKLNGPHWKKRRVRYRPKLTDAHKAQRVEFAKHFLSADPNLERRIVFLDEKRFEVVTSGTLTLPAEDDTPRRFVQSRTNPLYLMVLVAVMKPFGDFNGVVGRHAFTEQVFAMKNSKNREKGTPEQKAVNVSGVTYLASWKTIFKCLGKLIDDGLIEAATAANPLYLQDDNAKPHRAKIDKKDLVTDLICKMGLDEFGIHILPLNPRQPAQSPDTNPLDTFVFSHDGTTFPTYSCRVACASDD